LQDSLYFRQIRGGLAYVRSTAQPLSSGRSYTDNDKETIRRMNADLVTFMAILISKIVMLRPDREQLPRMRRYMTKLSKLA
jgi:hypothetical protein